jgi:hypothetical protein
MSTYSTHCRVTNSDHPLNGGLRATVGVEYHGSLVTAQSSKYDRFSPVANGWATIHLALDMAPPLQGEEEGPPT